MLGGTAEITHEISARTTRERLLEQLADGGDNAKLTTGELLRLAQRCLDELDRREGVDRALALDALGGRQLDDDRVAPDEGVRLQCNSGKVIMEWEDGSND